MTYKTDEEKRKANREKQKRWAKKHPEKHLAMVRKWEQDNSEQARQMYRKSRKKRATKLRQEAYSLTRWSLCSVSMQRYALLANRPNCPLEWQATSSY